MREALGNIKGKRLRFIAEFERFGSKRAYKGPPIVTLLFVDIRDKAGVRYTDHLWFSMNKTFEKLDLKPGDLISFDARVRSYVKGYRGRRDDEYSAPVSTDYKLSHPTNVTMHILPGKQGTLF